MGRRNAIIAAYERDEEEEELELSEDESEAGQDAAADEFTSEADAGEFTDEEVLEEVEAYETSRRAAVERSRQRGRASARGQRAPRDTAARAESRARNPSRERAEDFDWQPANTLEAPPPRPGMEQRWIRFQLGDKNDPRNWARKLRERWAPRTLDTVEEDLAPPTLRHAQLGEVIGVGDLILCERPKEIGIARRRYFRAKTQRQLAAAEHRAVDKVQTADGPEIRVQSKRSRPTLRRGTRRAEIQDE